MPFYVAPEQWMKDKADFARKGIARGRALVALNCTDGIIICAENASATLRKISEIYDRIAFAGAGRYNEYDRLRIAGIRHADLKGYSFSREDVDAQSLANAYAQMLGDVFTHEVKPMEVEILVAEVGATMGEDRLFHVLYDGTVVDETGYSVLGGEADVVTNRLEAAYQPELELGEALRVGLGALAGSRTLEADDLEVAMLARDAPRRAFQRLSPEQITDLIGSEPTPPEATPDEDEVATTDVATTEAADEPTEAPKKPAKPTKAASKTTKKAPPKSSD
jgi:proteasome alpha subunit